MARNFFTVISFKKNNTFCCLSVPNAGCEADIQETVKMNESALKTVHILSLFGVEKKTIA